MRQAISLTGQYAALDALQTEAENLRMMAACPVLARVRPVHLGHRCGPGAVSGQPADGHLVAALAWTGGIAVVSMYAAAALFRRGTR